MYLSRTNGPDGWLLLSKTRTLCSTDEIIVADRRVLVGNNKLGTNSTKRHRLDGICLWAFHGPDGWPRDHTHVVSLSFPSPRLHGNIGMESGHHETQRYPPR